ncbi:FAD-dependent oxidoreductase [Kitasatospora sp. GP82]|uniref:NAD(P)/FAD-dependent oxidoreductase n=1 Tax=Kitasatospora sp. GP82 TaxID=3035089 RepID=UPI002473F3C7|nr:FAD-dependent oxidoreductase [Kitasatospora sp. GP82]MDH6128107.1 3-phenylpropionate/trans-cinnamate dioxygenase ferredoxin reductase subunit [Kitasatospora sp. GP82]
MTTTPRHVVIAGASAAGLTAAETLRREGYNGHLTLIGDEPHLPYDRPPLSKQVLAGIWPPTRTALRSPDDHTRLDADLLLGRRATALHPSRRIIEVDYGEHIEYDALIIATGVTPRHLPQGHDLTGVHVLRTLDDAHRLRTHLLQRPRLAVVGAGFTGAEVAATACGLGLDVTLICRGPAPLAERLGGDIAHLVGQLHTDHGVRLRTGVGATSLVASHGRVAGLTLTDGTLVEADAVVVAIGSTPATDWLRTSGLDITDGVACDAYCQAAPGIYAAGDVARWHHPQLDAPIRLEHRTNATDQAITAARNLLGAHEPYAPVPYFWTDQYDTKIQAHGICTPGAQITVVHGDPAQRSFVALYSHDGRVTGALGWNSPRELRPYRELVAHPTPSEHATATGGP